MISTSALDDILNAFNTVFGPPIGGYIAGTILVFMLIVFIVLATEELSILSTLVMFAIGMALAVGFGWWPAWVAYLAIIFAIVAIVVEFRSRSSTSGGI